MCNNRFNIGDKVIFNDNHEYRGTQGIVYNKLIVGGVEMLTVVIPVNVTPTEVHKDEN